jgi:hypothetical protein
MQQIKIPAVFMRGGTNKAIVFHEQNLPRDKRAWDEIFLASNGASGLGRAGSRAQRIDSCERDLVRAGGTFHQKRNDHENRLYRTGLHL